ncbi:MAG: BamA/TamA family outer membrane protein [Bacteroidales bacterium]|nr:BamA/TamA family outer membrane protein [Bacteroidales bacterium]
MNRNFLSSIIHHKGIFILIMFILYLLTSCSPARRIPTGNYLLNKNNLKVDQKDVSVEELNKYIIQKPNKKILGVRFHLWLYNMANPAKTKWPHGWLKRIGEEPVIYNSDLTKQSTRQLKQFLENKGYYFAEITDSTRYKRKNAKVTYSVIPNEPYCIETIRYVFEDTTIVPWILSDTLHSLLKKGKIMDKSMLQDERQRIETYMKNNGFYMFSKEYIYFEARIIPSTFDIDMTMIIKDFVEGEPDPKTKLKPHKRYRINNLYVYPNYSPLDMAGQSRAVPVDFDTTYFEGTCFLHKGNPKIKLNVIADKNHIREGDYYSLSEVDRSYRNFSSLGLFRFVNINFKESDTIPVTGNDKYLDCIMELARRKVQSYQAELVGTNSSGDIGARGNILYQNWNLFRGAEVFSLRLTGALEAVSGKENIKLMYEVGSEVKISFPKFLAPVRMKKFVRRYMPKTSVTGSYNYQSRPDYTRSIANLSFSYYVEGKKYFTHNFWPIELNYIQLYEERSSKTWIDSIRTTYLGYSFESHMVAALRYGLEFNSQKLGKRSDYIFARINVESAGNLLNAVNQWIGADTIEGKYHILNVPYFQYIRGDIDFRYYNIVDPLNKLVYRLFIGSGYPLGNSKALPFEKKYFSGGPNSIRAWSTRDLGPGSYNKPKSDSVFQYPNQVADIKLEVNFEYRFRMFWKIEGAFFIDAGNIWAIRREDDREGAFFEWNRFYKEIAVGTGLGIRLDFNFFLIRFDFGLKLRDPALPDGERWIPINRGFERGDLKFQFGIGYPF